MTLWIINVIYYASAITLIEMYRKLKGCKTREKNVDCKRPWELVNESNQQNPPKISHIRLIKDCIEINPFTKKQRTVSTKVRKLGGSL